MTRKKRGRYFRDANRKRRRRARVSPFVLVVFLLVTVAATLGHVWIRFHVLRQQVMISSLETELERLEAGNEFLRMQLRGLSVVSQLEAAARRYGFVYPKPEQVVRLVKE